MPIRVRMRICGFVAAAAPSSGGGSSSTKMRYVFSAAAAAVAAPTRTFRRSPGPRVRSDGKKRTSSVAVSCISPSGPWSQAKALTSRRSVSALWFATVRSVLDVDVASTTWMGVTVKEVADARAARQRSNPSARPSGNFPALRAGKGDPTIRS